MADIIAGRVELIDPLAQGAAGTVWRAIDHRLDAICAAKIMRQRDGADILRFLREQSVGAGGKYGIAAHKHLVVPYTWVAEDDTIALLMPLIRGGTLAQALADNGPLTAELTAELLRQLLEALSAVHDAGWMHRDVKPANLLLDPTSNGRPHLRLADFGVALHKDAPRLTQLGQVWGTPGYLAPEQLKGHAPSFAQDIWAAGVVGLTTLAPDLDLAKVDDVSTVVDRVLPPSESTLRELLTSFLNPDPELRPTAREAAEQLAVRSAEQPGFTTAAGEVFEVFDQLEPHAAETREAATVELEASTGHPEEERTALIKTKGRTGQRWIPLLLFMVSAAALVVAVVLGYLAFRETASSELPVKALHSVCGWHEVNDVAETAEGVPLVCTRGEDGAYRWEQQ